MRCKRLPGRCFASPLPVCAKSSNKFNQLQYVGFECSRYSTCIHRMTRYHLLIPTTSQNLGQKAKSNLKATLYEPPITHPAKCVESDFDCFTIFTHKIIGFFSKSSFSQIRCQKCCSNNSKVRYFCFIHKIFFSIYRNLYKVAIC